MHSVQLTAYSSQAYNKQGIYLQVYPDVFDGIGSIPGPPYHIQVDPSITPKYTSCQPIPVHLKEPFKQEIDQMLQAGILKPVCQAKPWIVLYWYRVRTSLASSSLKFAWTLPM